MTGPGYQKLNEPRRTSLSLRNFTAVTQQAIKNVDSDVASLQVPDGLMLVLLHDQTPRLYLMARHEVGRVASAAGAAVPVTVAVNGEGRRMVRSTRGARNFPTTQHPDVQAWTQITGQPWQPANVLAVDWEAGTVEVETPPNAGKLRVYYLPGDGEIALRVSRPSGSNTGAIQLWRGPARGLHEVDQADRDTAPVMFREPKGLPQQFRLLFTTRMASVVVFDGMARHEINLPAAETAIAVTDPLTLADVSERQLRSF